MKRLHLHINVVDVDEAVRFYTTLFGTGPTVRKPDYAKWLLDDPRVNLAISRSGGAGLNHLGIQVDSRDELRGITSQLDAAGQETVRQSAAECCYAVGDKAWAVDPAGLAWETFYTFGEVTEYGDDRVPLGDLREAAGPDETSGKCCG